MPGHENKPLLVAAGEWLWDELPEGRRAGGAPANLAVHAAALGVSSALISAIGQDEDGDALISSMQTREVNLDAVARVALPTGTVGVQLSPEGKPVYEIRGPVAWDQIPNSPKAQALAETCDAFCFGTLARRSPISRSTIQALLARSQSDAWRVLDVNFRGQFFSQEDLENALEASNLLKLSDEELPMIQRLLRFPEGETVSEHLAELADRFELRLIVLTCGADGVILWEPENSSKLTKIDAVPVKATDTVGAGDSFTATFVSGLLLGMSPSTAALHATKIAAFVCTQNGATPTLPEKLLEEFHASVSAA